MLFAGNTDATKFTLGLVVVLDIEPCDPPEKEKPDGNPTAVCAPLYALPEGAVAVHCWYLFPGILSPGAPVIT